MVKRPATVTVASIPAICARRPTYATQKPKNTVTAMVQQLYFFSESATFAVAVAVAVA